MIVILFSTFGNRRLTDSSLVVSVSYWILESLRHHEVRSRTGDVVWKMNLHFTMESCDTSKSFTVKTIAKLNLERSSKFETQIWKINRCGLRFPDNAKCGHFTLRRQQERHQTKGLISKTMAVYVRYESLYISFQSSAKQQREMTSSASSTGRGRRRLSFRISIWNWTASLHI